MPFALPPVEDLVFGLDQQPKSHRRRSMASSIRATRYGLLVIDWPQYGDLRPQMMVLSVYFNQSPAVTSAGRRTLPLHTSAWLGLLIRFRPTSSPSISITLPDIPHRVFYPNSTRATAIALSITEALYASETRDQR